MKIVPKIKTYYSKGSEKNYIPIGEIFFMNGSKYIVVNERPFSCDTCDFQAFSDECLSMSCESERRKDLKNVAFKRIE